MARPLQLGTGMSNTTVQDASSVAHEYDVKHFDAYSVVIICHAYVQATSALGITISLCHLGCV